MLEALFQIFGEILLQLLFEAAAELGFHSLKETFRGSANPTLATLGFFLWGLLAGGVSLLLVPKSFISDPTLRLLTLIVTPFVAGTIMAQIGKLRERHSQNLVGLDRFGYAFAFALAMGLMRFLWTKNSA